MLKFLNIVNMFYRHLACMLVTELCQHSVNRCLLHSVWGVATGLSSGTGARPVPWVKEKFWKAKWNGSLCG